MSKEGRDIFSVINQRFAVLAVGYFVIAIVTSYVFYRSFSTFVPPDTAAYHQAIWNVAHGNGLRWTKLGGHMFKLRISPFLYVLSIPYSIFESYFTLSALRIGFFILGLYPFYRLIEQRYGKNASSAAFIAVAFHPAAFPALPQGFRVLPFTMVFLSWLIYYYETNRPIGYTLAALLVMSTHMGGISLLVPLSIWFYFQDGNRDWRQLLPSVIAIGWFIIASRVIFPSSSFSHTSGFPYGDSIGANIVGALLHPLHTIDLILGIKLGWVIGVVGPFAFVPLLSSVVLASGLYIGFHFMRGRVYTVIHPLKQYAFPLFPLLLYGIYREVDTAAEILRSVGNRIGGTLGEWLYKIGTPQRVLYVIATISILSMLLTSFVLFGAVSESDNRYSLDQPLAFSERDEAAWNLIHQIPSGEPVMATYLYHPPLAQRADLHQFPPLQKECWINPGPAYILLDTRVDWQPGPEASKNQMRTLIKSENTDVVDRRKGIILLRERQSVDGYGGIRIKRVKCKGELTGL
jgi:hypothetical protein